MFDEMYLQKCQEHFLLVIWTVTVKVNYTKDLLQRISYVIKSSPETKINADLLKEELIYCLEILCRPGFNVRAIVCDNHPSNVSSFKILLQHFNQDPDELFIWFELRKIYLFYDAAHLVKNIRNNLLNYKRFIFSSFQV